MTPREGVDDAGGEGDEDGEWIEETEYVLLELPVTPELPVHQLFRIVVQPSCPWRRAIPRPALPVQRGQAERARAQGLESNEPVLQLDNGTSYVGAYEDTVGTLMAFDVVRAPEPKLEGAAAPATDAAEADGSAAIPPETTTAPVAQGESGAWSAPPSLPPAAARSGVPHAVFLSRPRRRRGGGVRAQASVRSTAGRR